MSRVPTRTLTTPTEVDGLPVTVKAATVADLPDQVRSGAGMSKVDMEVDADAFATGLLGPRRTPPTDFRTKGSR